MQTFHLPIAMGGVWWWTDMFDIVGGTKSIEGAPEFGTIVGADSARVTK
jgi:hypothetical protein